MGIRLERGGSKRDASGGERRLWILMVDAKGVLWKSLEIAGFLGVAMVRYATVLIHTTINLPAREFSETCSPQMAVQCHKTRFQSFSFLESYMQNKTSSPP
jgi:hypothetical protein